MVGKNSNTRVESEDDISVVGEAIHLGLVLDAITDAVAKLDQIPENPDVWLNTVPESVSVVLGEFATFLAKNALEDGKTGASFTVEVKKVGGLRRFEVTTDEGEVIPTCAVCGISMRSAGNTFVCEECGQVARPDVDTEDDDGSDGQINDVSPGKGPDNGDGDMTGSTIEKGLEDSSGTW